MPIREPRDLSDIACTAIQKLFQTDVTGEPTLEAIKLISKMIKGRNYKVPESVLKTFLYLKLGDEMGAGSSDSFKDKKKSHYQHENSRKRKREDKKNMSKKMRKIAKKESEVESELKEAEAEVDREEKQKRVEFFFHLIVSENSDTYLTEY